jgi:hypothetical protein
VIGKDRYGLDACENWKRCKVAGIDRSPDGPVNMSGRQGSFDAFRDRESSGNSLIWPKPDAATFLSVPAQ